MEDYETAESHEITEVREALTVLDLDELALLHLILLLGLKEIDSQPS